MKFKGDRGFLDLIITLENDETLPSYGDAYVSLKVSSNGYCGENACWVDAPVYRKFCAAVTDLEKHRQGEAVLKSLSPGEFELRIFSVDAQGHMAVEGVTRHSVKDGEHSFKHSVSFGFLFDSSQLNETV